MYHVSSELAYVIAGAYVITGIVLIVYMRISDAFYLRITSKCAVFVSAALFIISGLWFMIPVIPPIVNDGWVNLNDTIGFIWSVCSFSPLIILVVNALWRCIEMYLDPDDIRASFTSFFIGMLATSMFCNVFSGYEEYTEGNVTVTSAEGTVLFEYEGLYKNDAECQILSYVDKDGNIQEYSYASTVSSSGKTVVCE